MGTITVVFDGICTQVKLPEADGTTLHRAVMVHGEHDNKGVSVNTTPIPPHRTFLMVSHDNVVQDDLDHVKSVMVQQNDGNWELDGARLFIQDALGSSVTYDKTTFSVPSLTTLTPDFGALSHEVVFGDNAAAHFDVSSGTFTATQNIGKNYVTILNVTTTTNTVVLGIEDLNVVPGSSSGSISFKSGSTITVSNTGGTLGDTPVDFLLHYLTAAVVPADAKVPDITAIAAAEAMPVTPENEAVLQFLSLQLNLEVLGPGCSNSNYP